MPFIVSDVNYWLSGESAELIPADYFTNPASMMRYQTDKIRRHMARYDDDYVPFLFPWYGTGVLPSALGAEILFQEKLDPAVHGAIITEPEQVRKLDFPDFHKDGLMPRVLETIRYFREHSDLPISCTDPQGPFTTALTLVGPETLFLWLYEYPQAVHELMEFTTELFIRWVKVQKQEIGADRGRDCFPHGILLPSEFGNVWLCDDDCGQISTEQYLEFVVPYNSKVFREFGGGTLHFCGSAEHQIENFAATEGLVGLNNFCMGNFRQVYKMQACFENRIALKVCDFVPLHIKEYYAELFRHLQRKGTIVSSYILPELALNNGKYEIIMRPAEKLSDQVFETFQAVMNSPQAVSRSPLELTFALHARRPVDDQRRADAAARKNDRDVISQPKNDR
ncbi:MAG: uroporphyrinogen decarboxylase family protein [Verrucomicrobiota bacterium]